VTDTASKLLEKYFPHGTAELCGVVTKRGAIVELENIHETPDLGFHIEPKAFLEDPNLSEEDMAGFLQWPELKHYIVGIRDGAPAVQAFIVADGFVLCE